MIDFKVETGQNKQAVDNKSDILTLREAKDDFVSLQSVDSGLSNSAFPQSPTGGIIFGGLIIGVAAFIAKKQWARMRREAYIAAAFRDADFRKD